MLRQGFLSQGTKGILKESILDSTTVPAFCILYWPYAFPSIVGIWGVGVCCVCVYQEWTIPFVFQNNTLLPCMSTLSRSRPGFPCGCSPNKVLYAWAKSYSSSKYFLLLKRMGLGDNSRVAWPEGREEKKNQHRNKCLWAPSNNTVL